MIPFRRFLVCSLALAVMATATLTGVPAAQAQELEPAVIVVVDMQRVLHDSLAGKTIEGQMEQQRTSFGEMISQQEAALRQEEKELQEQAALLASDVLAERRRQFEEKVVALQRDVRERQQSLEQSYATGVNQVRVVIVEILQAMIAERGIDLVVPSTSILVGSRTLDVTDEVLQQLDQRLPSVSLSQSGG
jgi:outer membrane protein